MNVPLHKKIRQDILNKIQTNEYAENQLIPTELELADIYSVSRPTVRQAIQSLVNEGYLEKRKKRGTIVKRPKIQQEFTHVIESYDSEMSRKGLVPETSILKFGIVQANEEVSKNLEVPLDSKVYKLIRLRYAEKTPVVLVTSYIPYTLFPKLREIDFSQEKLYHVLEEMGHPIKTVSRKLEIIKADETTSDLLDIDAEEPVFYFHTQGFSESHVPIEYSISKYRGDRNSFIFELSQ
ncbi:transcriptional regulator [Marinilactibacillus sp. 15R]|uniref:GntR family transcriptional regulator n=1 Tax=Marinilactibacillus piezotolerans TaxID=258723 RepID=A0A1I3YBG9_9LACT|nr:MULTISPECIES: GntR family transcriptional regulator [Marinilactibacillus]API88462.1 transcriptional regulator [Marinilactibacillus sp. 15R]SFK28729.1 GntR family transcriptional regulator [Marinilactibacillus piezotolerans]